MGFHPPTLNELATNHQVQGCRVNEPCY